MYMLVLVVGGEIFEWLQDKCLLPTWPVWCGYRQLWNDYSHCLGSYVYKSFACAVAPPVLWSQFVLFTSSSIVAACLCKLRAQTNGLTVSTLPLLVGIIRTNDISTTMCILDILYILENKLKRMPNVYVSTGMCPEGLTSSYGGMCSYNSACIACFCFLAIGLHCT